LEKEPPYDVFPNEGDESDRNAKEIEPARILNAPVTGVTVLVDTNGQLGVLSSSAAFQGRDQAHDTAIEVILSARTNAILLMFCSFLRSSFTKP
jgi:hypothetical protein